MKKFTMFLIGGLMILITSAFGQQARVILNSNSNYEIQIDGRNYTGNNSITDLGTGLHTVSVYQVVSNGILGIGKKRNLISTEQFNLGNNDVNIDVSQNGQLRISQNGYSGNNTRRDRNSGYDRDENENNRYGKSEGKGNGHKYGHYKNKNKNKNKNKKEKRHDD